MRDTGAAEGVADHPMDGIHADRCIVWSQGAHEDGSVAGERSLVAQVRLTQLLDSGPDYELAAFAPDGTASSVSA